MFSGTSITIQYKYVDYITCLTKVLRKFLSKSNKKSPNYQNYEFLQVDLHSHLVPGIDDGSDGMDETIEMCQFMADLGFKKMITTPHIHKGLFDNNSEDIKRGVDAVRIELRNRGVVIEIQAACEYYADEFFLELLKRRDILTLGEKHLLFELSMWSLPSDVHAVVFAIRTAGYIPVIAHLERYRWLPQRMELVDQFETWGVLRQLNLGSLSGAYGPEAANLASDLLNRGKYELAASDLHRPFQFPMLQEALRHLPVYPFQNAELFGEP